MHDHQDDRWQRGWRKFERMAQRFGRESGFGRGNWDGFGGNFRIGRMLASGDLRLVALYLIEQQPRHGYDLIKAVEEQSQGFYSPSPGIVYPALTFLEEAGYVTSATDGNKKLYTITHEGRSHLADNREAIQATLDFLAKAGAEVNKWRDMAREGWPFSEEQRAQFREMKEPGWPHDRGGPHRRPGHGHGPGPDRDMRDVIPEVNEARRALKATLAEIAVLSEDQQREVAQALHQANDRIRQIAKQAGDDVDL